MIVKKDSKLENLLPWPEGLYRKVLVRGLLLYIGFMLIPFASYMSH